MATRFNSTPLPVCSPATTAIDAIARARALGQTAHLALESLENERASLAVGAVLHVMTEELSAAEAALSSCAGYRG